jgi:hypothetical protein
MQLARHAPRRVHGARVGRIVELMLGHASIQQAQRYLYVTDEELRRGLEDRLAPLCLGELQLLAAGDRNRLDLAGWWTAA